MSAILAACFALVTGLVIGAGLQRWGDGDRATHGHKTIGVVYNGVLEVDDAEWVAAGARWAN